jgi:hypothetical protein
VDYNLVRDDIFSLFRMKTPETFDSVMEVAVQKWSVQCPTFERYFHSQWLKGDAPWPPSTWASYARVQMAKQHDCANLSGDQAIESFNRLIKDALKSSIFRAVSGKKAAYD